MNSHVIHELCPEPLAHSFMLHRNDRLKAAECDAAPLAVGHNVVIFSVCHEYHGYLLSRLRVSRNW